MMNRWNFPISVNALANGYYSAPERLMDLNHKLFMEKLKDGINVVIIGYGTESTDVFCRLYRAIFPESIEIIIVKEPCQKNVEDTIQKISELTNKHYDFAYICWNTDQKASGGSHNPASQYFLTSVLNSLCEKIKDDGTICGDGFSLFLKSERGAIRDYWYDDIKKFIDGSNSTMSISNMNMLDIINRIEDEEFGYFRTSTVRSVCDFVESLNGKLDLYVENDRLTFQSLMGGVHRLLSFEYIIRV